MGYGMFEERNRSIFVAAGVEIRHYLPYCGTYYAYTYSIAGVEI